MKKFLLIFMVYVLSIGQVSAQEPTPDPVGSGGATATEKCSQLAIQIGGKQAAIAMLTARIATSQAAGLAAEKDMYTAAANAVREPLLAHWWNMLSLYHAGRVLYWADAIHADMFLRSNLETELDALLKAYALEGC